MTAKISTEFSPSNPKRVNVLIEGDSDTEVNGAIFNFCEEHDTVEFFNPMFIDGKWFAIGNYIVPEAA